MFLIFDSDEETMLSYRRFLYAENLLSIGCGYHDCPRLPETITPKGVMLTNPYDKNMPIHFPYSCHTRFPGLPVIGLIQSLRQTPQDIGGYDILIDVDLPPQKFIDTLLMEVSRYHARDIADHMADCARDHILMSSPTWGGNPLYLTHTERMIYRYLIDTYPRLVTPKELLRYCMKPGTSPQLCIIPTHIYHINQKAKEEFGVPIIHCPGGMGYRLIPSCTSSNTSP